MKELFEPISFLKKGIASAVIVCLIWTQFCVGTAMAVKPSDADLGIDDVIIYQRDSQGFTTSAMDTTTGLQTMYFAGGMIDYTYYVTIVNGERIETKVTDYDYHPDGSIKTITDCATGEYIEYGNIGKDLDGDGKLTGDEIKGWGAVFEWTKDGRRIGIYKYNEEGELAVKHILGDKDDSTKITSSIIYEHGKPKKEVAFYLLVDNDGDPNTDSVWMRTDTIPHLDLDYPATVREWGTDARGDYVVNYNINVHTITSAEVEEFERAASEANMYLHAVEYYGLLLYTWAQENGTENYTAWPGWYSGETWANGLAEMIEVFGGLENFFNAMMTWGLGAGTCQFSLTTETTRLDQEGNAIAIFRDGEQVGGFEYENGVLQSSWYVDPEGMRTDSTYDGMGRILTSITEGDITQEVDLGHNVEKRYQYITVHVRSVTTFNYNNTGQDVTNKYKDEDKNTVKVTVPPGGLISSTTETTTSGFAVFDISSSGVIPIEGKAKVIIDNITETTTLYDGGIATHSESKNIHQGSRIDVNVDEGKAIAVAGLVLVICIALSWATSGLSLYAWGAAAVSAYQTYDNIMDMEGENPVPNLPDTVYDPNNAYDEISLQPPIQPPTEAEFGVYDSGGYVK